MFSPDIVDTLPGPRWLRERRALAARRAAEQPLPTFEAEEWRYSPIADFRPEAFAPAAQPPAGFAGRPFPVADAAASVHTVDGFVVAVDIAEAGAAGLEVHTAADLDDAVDLGDPVDVFGEANSAFAPHPVVVAIQPGRDIEGPVVITHDVHTDGVAAFPRVQVNVGADASVQVVEIFRSTDVSSWVVPVTHFVVGSAARVRYQQVQELGSAMWQLGSLMALSLIHI